MQETDQRMTVHPSLARQNTKFEPSIRTVAGRYHVAYGYSPSNCTLIEGDDGCVLVDTLPTVEFAEPVAEAFRRITDKPIRAVIYTHVHPDHISGVKAFVSEEDVRSGAVEIIALDELTDHLARDSGLLAPVLARRAMYTFGFQLPRDESGNVGTGLGPPNIPGRRSFIAPTRTFRRTGGHRGCRRPAHADPPAERNRRPGRRLERGRPRSPVGRRHPGRDFPQHLRPARHGLPQPDGLGPRDRPAAPACNPKR